MVKDQVIRMGINDQTRIHKIVSSIEAHSASEYGTQLEQMQRTNFIQFSTKQDTHTHTSKKLYPSSLQRKPRT
jgi:hypothetical protein